jgi:hypothetical protein
MLLKIKLRLFFITLLTFFTFTQILPACSVCGCGDPLAAAGSAHPLADTFRLSLDSIYLTASAQSDDLMSTESVRQVNLNSTLTYSPTNDLSLSVMLPVVEKYFKVTAPIGPDDGTPFGIGDMMLGARYFFLSDTDFKTKEHTGMAVSGGLYFPTGGTSFTSVITGQNLDTHAQLGTGAWAFYGGLLYNHVWDDFALSANANFILRTRAGTTDPTSPVYQYAFGNAFTGGVQGQLHVSDAVAVSLAAEGRYAASDTYMNPAFGPGIADTPNTGGTVLDATPGLWWNISGDSTLYAKVQIPVYTSLNGVQEVDPTYLVGTQFLIH